jgi:hypothetical protein
MEITQTNPIDWILIRCDNMREFSDSYDTLAFLTEEPFHDIRPFGARI